MTKQLIFRIIFLLIGFIFQNTLQAQIAKISPCKKYLAIGFYDGKQKDEIIKGGRKQTYFYHILKVNIYDLISKDLKNSFLIKQNKKDNFSELFFSNNSKILFARKANSKDYKMWNLKSGELIKTFYAKTSFFFKKENTFLIYDYGNSLKKYNHKFKLIKEFWIDKKISVKKICLSENEQNIVILDNKNQVWFCKQKTNSFKKIDEAIDFKFLNNNKILLLTSNKKIHSFDLIRNKRTQNLTKKIRKEKLLEFKKYSHYQLVNIEKNKIALLVEGSNKYEKAIIIVDILSGEILFKNSDFNTSDFFWTNKNKILIKEDKLQSFLFDIDKDSNSKKWKYTLSFNRNETVLSNDNQISSQIISSNKKFVAIPFSNSKKNGIYLKNASLKQHHTYKNISSFCFDEDNKYLIIKKKQKIGLIKLPQNDNKKPKIEFLFNKKNKQNTDNETTDNQINTKKESEISNDAKPPEGYRHVQIKNFVSADKYKNKEKNILFDFKNVSLKGNYSSVNFHLLDANGNLISGVGKNSNKIICDVFLKMPDGKIQKIKKLNLKEYNSKKYEPIATILILDHSGSMGDKRAEILQNGVKNFINKKRPQDAVAIIKYDHKVGIECKLSKSKKNLTKKLKINKLKGYGTRTALLDAINAGLQELRFAKFKEKQIIILTDGNENCSKSNKKNIILKAIDYDIKIHTVGFGEEISKPYLKSIAYNTGGTFYSFYDSKNLQWIYNDVFTRENNYYSLAFKTPKKGKYVAYLKNCNNSKEEIMVAFDTEERNFDLIKEKKEDIFGIPLAKLKNSEKNKQNFRKLQPMPQINQIVSSTKNNLKYHIEKEFYDIKFPDIKFITNTTTIIKGTDKGIKDVTIFLKKYNHINIEISGHTDNVGEINDNQILSERRAAKVKSLLTNTGIKSLRIKTIGHGESKPIDNNKTSKGRRNNRRVVFKIID